LAFSQGANAALTISAVVGGAPLPNTQKINFDGLALGGANAVAGGINVSFTGTGQVVQGSDNNPQTYAPPVLSVSNGLGFGSPDQVTGPDATHYLTTGIGSATLDFTTPQTYFGLLWGSIDSYNTLTFYDSANQSVGSVSGQASWIAPALLGNQGANATAYVNITSTLAFTKVVASSTQNAFEFDNVAIVPEPSTYVAGGLALLPLLFGLRSRFMKK